MTGPQGVGPNPTAPARSTTGAKRDLATSVVLAVITVVYLVQAVHLPSSGATRTDIGPAAYPLLIGVFLGAVTAVLATRAIVALFRAGRARAGSVGASGPRLPIQLRALVAMVVVTAVYVWLLAPIGFLIATAVYLAVQLLIVGGVRRYRPRRFVVIAVVFGCVGSVAIYVVFAGLLGVLLPPGVFAPVLI